jgi:capsule polysaccharide export protein KpsE/RkpR
MNPEELELLKKTAALAEENSLILHKMQKSARWARGFKIVYWILIIALSIFGLWGFQTYLQNIQSAFTQSGLSGASSTNGAGSSNGPSSISGLLNSI